MLDYRLLEDRDCVLLITEALAVAEVTREEHRERQESGGHRVLWEALLMM